MVKLIENKN